MTEMTKATVEINIHKIIRLMIDSSPSDELIPLNRSLKKFIIIRHELVNERDFVTGEQNLF